MVECLLGEMLIRKTFAWLLREELDKKDYMFAEIYVNLNGSLNGSTINERTTNTSKMTGKKLLLYSTYHGSGTSLKAPV